MTDLSKELPENATPEEIAARSCAEAAMHRIQGWKGAEVAVGAFGQAQQSQAAITGLIQLLLHKGLLSQAELGDSMAWAYHQRAAQLNEQAKKSSIVLPDAPAARHRQ
jgi:hypothetical protein